VLFGPQAWHHEAHHGRWGAPLSTATHVWKEKCVVCWQCWVRSIAMYEAVVRISGTIRQSLIFYDILLFYKYWCHCVESTQLQLLLLEHRCTGYFYTMDTSLYDMRLLGATISLWKPTLGFHPNSPTSHSHSRHSRGPTRLLHHRSLLPSNSSKTIVEEVPRKWGRCITSKMMKESRSDTVVPETVWLKWHEIVAFKTKDTW